MKNLFDLFEMHTYKGAPERPVIDEVVAQLQSHINHCLERLKDSDTPLSTKGGLEDLSTKIALTIAPTEEHLKFYIESKQAAIAAKM